MGQDFLDIQKSTKSTKTNYQKKTVKKFFFKEKNHHKNLPQICNSSVTMPFSVNKKKYIGKQKMLCTLTIYALGET